MMKLENCYWLSYNEDEHRLEYKETEDFKKNRKTALKEIKQLSDDIKTQKSICAKLWDINDCQTDERFIVPESIWREHYIKLIGLKAEKKREEKFLKRLKFYQAFGNSVAMMLTDDLNKKYKDKYAKNYGVATKEFKERLKIEGSVFKEEK